MTDATTMRDLLTSLHARATGALVEVASPWDGAPVGVLATHTVADVDVVVAGARRVQRTWAAWSIQGRAKVMRRFGALVLERRDELIDLVQAETGKARVNALEEVLDVAMMAPATAALASRTLRTRRRRGAVPVMTTTHEVRHPKGVVGVITPWNYPFTLAATDVVPALLAGNAVVLKPDLKTPHSALAVLALLREAGLPDGVLQVVVGDGPEIGGAVVDRVDFVMFTGSSATGAAVATRCAERLVGCSAELGGKNPMVVLEDADVAAAARGAARTCFSNAGQLCVSIERIYVPDRIADAFIAALLREVGDLRLGAGPDWGIDVGPLISVEQLDRVRGHVDDAVARGARVLAGGRARPDLSPTMFEPTILTDVPADALAAERETFGPVVSVYRVADDDEAIARANDSDFGLNASLWTTRRDARSVAERIAAGSVNVNEVYAATLASHDAPMGGWKRSGMGTRHGREGLLKYTDVQTIARQRGRPIGPWPGMTNETYADIMTRAVGVMSRLR